MAQSLESFTSLVTFGDSLSDTGTNPPPAGLDYYQGRWSNGPLWDDYLAAALGAGLDNFAYAGSETSDLSNQVSALAAQSKNLSSSLCTVWSGGNDFIDNTNAGLSQVAWSLIVNKGIANVSNAVQRLCALGARNILVANVPDLSKTPAGLASPYVFRTFVQSMIQLFNTDLAAALSSIAQAYPNVKIVSLDAYSLLDEVIANPGPYGFTNVNHDALDDFTNPAFNGPATNYLFWDPIHPTTQGHQLVFRWATNALTAAPPSIRTQPISQRAAIGSQVVFSVVASNAEFYQWSFDGHALSGATNSNYSLAPVKATEAGSYSVVASNAFGTATSSNAVLTTYIPVVITLQPRSHTNAQGTTTTFAVTATGVAPLSFQWRFHGTNIPGATHSVLTLSKIDSPQAGSYQVVVTNSNNSVTSAVATLTVLLHPTILAQPSPATFIAGRVGAIFVDAAGTPPLAFQWELNGHPVAGATRSALSFTNVQTSQAGEYSVKVSNAAGFAVSSSALITVHSPPKITLEPAGQTNAPGKTIQLKVAATGTAPLTYQWQFDRTNLPNATSSILTLANVQTNQSGTYAVVVSNSAGTATSSNAVVVIKASSTHP